MEEKTQNVSFTCVFCNPFLVLARFNNCQNDPFLQRSSSFIANAILSSVDLILLLEMKTVLHSIWLFLCFLSDLCKKCSLYKKCVLPAVLHADRVW